MPEPKTTPTPELTDDQLLKLPPRFARPDAELPADTVLIPAPAEVATLGLVRVLTGREYAARLAHLSAPFPAEQMEKLPKLLRQGDQDKGRCEPGSHVSGDGYYCGGWHARSIHLDYVGHAGVTMRLLEVDPLWSWEAVEQHDGVPVLRYDGAWVRLTVLGMTRLGFGDASGKSGPNAMKEVIGDALRNAAMRFGVATYLWSKSEASAVLKAGGDLDADTPPPAPRPEPTPRQQRRQAAGRQQAAQPAQGAPEQQPAELPAPTAVAFRARVLAAADGTEPGAQRDAMLRALRDEVMAAKGLGNTVPLPPAWSATGAEDEQVTLLQLILGARTVKVPSGTPATTDDYDPWASQGATEEQQA